MVIGKKFNPLTLSLQGVALIEASAGTGKTYTLVVLYLRLLLGLGETPAYLRPLRVEEILVMTFTKSAMGELRGRIRETIQNFRLACVRNYSNDPILATLLKQLKDSSLAATQLLAAERRMDEAAIFTIHGFCQQVLNQYVMESGLFFKQSLLEDESLLRKQVSADFWRRHCYPLPFEVACIVEEYWDGPDSLLEELLPYLQGELPVLRNCPDKIESILDRHRRIIVTIDVLKDHWRSAVKSLEGIISAHQMNRQVYSQKNLRVWLKKISLWASQLTINYGVPTELERFRNSVLIKKTLHGESPFHPIFEAIEQFFQSPPSLKELIFILALHEMRQALKQEKHLLAKTGFDDLVSCLDNALISDGGESLAESVRGQYPVAMIDEFQDTDPQQYRILRRLYCGQFGLGLLLIGDPKQAIYSFRGADIFTYMRACGEVDFHYTIDTNWRSSPGMIRAVNQLFQCTPDPFIFQDIPFQAGVAVKRNANLRLLKYQQVQPAMHFWVQATSATGIKDYQQVMARQCAVTVRGWLSAARDGAAWFEGYQGRQALQASDITVLVRNRHEAILITDALSALSIPAVYLSNSDSVFETSEARELLWLLWAVLRPDEENSLRLVLATRLFGLDASAIETINTNVDGWDKWVEKFTGYRQLWKKHGFFPMLHQIMIRHCIAESLLMSIDGERRLTNVLHLGELLQEASVKLEHEYALVRWFALQINTPNPRADNQKLRLESDRHLVKLITVHKSKGLEFPVVFLPFAADFRQQKYPLFHDREQYQACLDLAASPESLELAEEERLAEDLRLLYVAVTRSIYHCSIGIAPVFRGRRKKNKFSDFHLSAVGYLIQEGQEGDFKFLHRQLKGLLTRSGGDIELSDVRDPQALPLASSAVVEGELASQDWKAPVRDPWNVTSYTALQRNSAAVMIDLKTHPNVEKVCLTLPLNSQQLTPHTFPRGTSSGIFLHTLFEVLNFTHPMDNQWLSSKLVQNGIDMGWLPVLQQWIDQVITTPLDDTSLSLGQLDRGSCHAELQFYLCIDQVVEAEEVDQLCKRYDPLSVSCPPLNFPNLKGILKGFIDLVFRWKKRYYLLDYKSNWLGEESSAYTRQALEKTMIAHRYELQYQLYTLAVHRYLRQRLLNYDYDRDFGGVFYLFFRGIDPIFPGNGIYAYRPNVALIKGLDRLFIGACPISPVVGKGNSFFWYKSKKDG